MIGSAEVLTGAPIMFYGMGHILSAVSTGSFEVFTPAVEFGLGITIWSEGMYSWGRARGMTEPDVKDTEIENTSHKKGLADYLSVIAGILPPYNRER